MVGISNHCCGFGDMAFFLFRHYESLVVKRRKIKYVWVYPLTNWLIVIGGSILFFVAFRLYKYGYV